MVACEGMFRIWVMFRYVMLGFIREHVTLWLTERILIVLQPKIMRYINALAISEFNLHQSF